MPGIRRDSKGQGDPIRIKIELLDSDNRPLFIWYPTSTKVAKGLRKALDFTVEKLGVNPEEEGIHLSPLKEPVDPDLMVMVQGAIHAGLVVL